MGELRSDFADGAGSFGQVFWFKLPAALFDLGLLAALYKLLRLHELAPERLLLYAWLSVTGVRVLGERPQRLDRGVLPDRGAGGGARGAAVVLGGSCGVVVGVFALLAWPYRSNIVENARFSSGFLGGWRNNDFLFGFLLKAAHGDLVHAKYAAFAILGLALAILTVARPTLERGALWAVTAMLAVSASIHPWYLTWFLPFLTMLPAAPLLLWSALMPLTYAVLIDWFAVGRWDGATGNRWYVYLPVILLAGFRLAGLARASLRGRRL